MPISFEPEPPQAAGQPRRKILETFVNPHPERSYCIAMQCPEFTCVCPKTGQPDFAEVRIDYTPDQLCVELKSLKLYLWSYRHEGAFHEAVTNRILDDLVAVVAPRVMTVTSLFNVRGGITTSVIASYPEKGKRKKEKKGKSKKGKNRGKDG
ncbi:MAG: NADPH-dependent 7-cyano-7-deazaguanine reductase QueF [Magnetococcales bacterium]|nr:NADPH-dependent 7-cyano-7-deazaguanine reductase QueF [Magnetococcales bacterium]